MFVSALLQNFFLLLPILNRIDSIPASEKAGTLYLRISDGTAYQRRAALSLSTILSNAEYLSYGICSHGDEQQKQLA